MPLYLGFDASTQSLTATVIDTDAGRVVFEDAVIFDAAFPSYGTRHGVHTVDDRTVTSPPLIWVEALDAMMARLGGSGIDLRHIRAIAGAGQQHGSVYLAADAFEVLARVDASRPLAPQLANVFTRAESPVWLDCSTT